VPLPSKDASTSTRCPLTRRHSTPSASSTDSRLGGRSSSPISSDSRSLRSPAPPQRVRESCLAKTATARSRLFSSWDGGRRALPVFKALRCCRLLRSLQSSVLVCPPRHCQYVANIIRRSPPSAIQRRSCLVCLGTHRTSQLEHLEPEFFQCCIEEMEWW
jgi:hypothetical protein